MFIIFYYILGSFVKSPTASFPWTEYAAGQNAFVVEGLGDLKLPASLGRMGKGNLRKLLNLLETNQIKITGTYLFVQSQN